MLCTAFRSRYVIIDNLLRLDAHAPPRSSEWLWRRRVRRHITPLLRVWYVVLHCSRGTVGVRGADTGVTAAVTATTVRAGACTWLCLIEARGTVVATIWRRTCTP